MHDTPLPVNLFFILFISSYATGFLCPQIARFAANLGLYCASRITDVRGLQCLGFILLVNLRYRQPIGTYTLINLLAANPSIQFRSHLTRIPKT